MLGASAPAATLPRPLGARWRAPRRAAGEAETAILRAGAWQARKCVALKRLTASKSTFTINGASCEHGSGDPLPPRLPCVSPPHAAPFGERGQSLAMAAAR